MIGEESGANESAAVDAAVELMKSDHTPASVKRALVERGLSAERAEAVFAELRRLKADQELAALDADLQKQNARSVAEHQKTKDRRSGFRMMLAGFFILAWMLRLIFLEDNWAPSNRPDLDNVPRLLLATMGVVVMVAGLLKRRGWF